MYVCSVCMYVVICQIDHCIHKHWCIVMGLGHNDPWVESHMWPQQTWGQRSCRGQWTLVQVFGKKDQCIHILWCIFKSNIAMIAKVCARKSRRDSWFENRLVEKGLSSSENLLILLMADSRACKRLILSSIILRMIIAYFSCTKWIEVKIIVWRR